MRLAVRVTTAAGVRRTAIVGARVREGPTAIARGTVAAGPRGAARVPAPAAAGSRTKRAVVRARVRPMESARVRASVRPMESGLVRVRVRRMVTARVRVRLLASGLARVSVRPTGNDRPGSARRMVTGLVRVSVLPPVSGPVPASARPTATAQAPPIAAASVTGVLPATARGTTAGVGSPTVSGMVRAPRAAALPMATGTVMSALARLTETGPVMIEDAKGVPRTGSATRVRLLADATCPAIVRVATRPSGPATTAVGGLPTVSATGVDTRRGVRRRAIVGRSRGSVGARRTARSAARPRRTLVPVDTEAQRAATSAVVPIGAATNGVTVVAAGAVATSSAGLAPPVDVRRANVTLRGASATRVRRRTSGGPVRSSRTTSRSAISTGARVRPCAP